MTGNVQRAPLRVSEHMTRQPHSIGADQTLASAADRMANLQVGQIPVLHGGRLVGVLSGRDIALIRSVVGERLDRATVEEVMTAVPYCVTADVAVSDVARHMASRKLDSAVVVDHNGNVEGVFTSQNALEILANVLDKNLPAAMTAERLRAKPVVHH